PTPRDLHPFPTRRSSDLAGAGEITRRFGDGDAPAFTRVKSAVERIAIGSRSQDFVCFPQIKDGRIRSGLYHGPGANGMVVLSIRSEEHTSELQSPYDLVC